MKENPTNKIIFEVTQKNCPFTSKSSIETYERCGIILDGDDYFDRRKCDFEKCPLREMSFRDIVEMCEENVCGW